MYCPNCGSPNAEGARFCEKCGTSMGVPAAPMPPVGAPMPGPVGGPGMGGAPTAGAAPQPQWQAPPQQTWQPPPPQGYVDPRAAHRSGVAIGPDGKRYAVGKEPVVALLLSLFFVIPVGQFYNGDVKKG